MRKYSQTRAAYCPACKSFEIECFVDPEEYMEPCDSFEPYESDKSLNTTNDKETKDDRNEQP